jgi:hypothetical protein
MPRSRPLIVNARRKSFGLAVLLGLTGGNPLIAAGQAAYAADLPAAPATVSEPTGKPEFTKRATVLVLPVVVGGLGEPPAAIIEALAKGLRDNLNWDVTVPSASTAVAVPTYDTTLLETAIAAVNAVVPATGAAAPAPAPASIQDLSATYAQLVQASTKAPLGAKGAEALIKVGGALLSAQVAAGQDETARTTASELKLLLPARKFSEADGLSFVAAAVLGAAPVVGVQTEFKTNPVQCSIEINGVEVAKGVVELPLRSGTLYSVQARCPANATGLSAAESFPRVVSVGEGPSKFVLDAAFPSHLKNSSSGLALSFDNSDQRQNLEEAYARRLADRYGVNGVVLASVGEFQSAEWLNARLYLASGYKNRHALVRIELERATALGRYLATGKESPGVLNAEEAGNMVVASRTLKPVAASQVKPAAWYEDVPAWCFVGAGAASLALGIWANTAADDKRKESALSVDDPFRQDQLNTDASTLKFLGGIGTYGGLLLVGTGAVLLALPDYSDTRSELYGLSPLPGGGQFTYRGRF